MTNFSVNIFGLEELKQALDSDIFDRKVVIGLSKAVNEVHKVLQDEVFKRYTFVKKLASVRVGGSHDLRYLPGAKANIHQELVYTGTRFSLGTFPSQENTMSNSLQSFFHASYYKKEGIFERKAPLNQIKVMIVRGRMKSPNRPNVKAFKQNSQVELGGGKNIFTRKAADVAKYKKLFIEGETNPDYTRTNLRMLYGPSLPEAAGWVYEHNSHVQETVDKVSDIILEELTKP